MPGRERRRLIIQRRVHTAGHTADAMTTNHIGTAMRHHFGAADASRKVNPSSEAPRAEDLTDDAKTTRVWTEGV